MVLNTEAALEQFKRDTDFKLGAGLSVDCESMLPATEACVSVFWSSSCGIAAGQQRLMIFAADIKPNEAADSVTGDSLKAKLTTGESDAFVFTWAGGLLFDLTVTAGVTTPATRENAKVYGQSASPTQVRLLRM